MVILNVNVENHLFFTFSKSESITNYYTNFHMDEFVKENVINKCLPNVKNEVDNVCW